MYIFVNVYTGGKSLVKLITQFCSGLRQHLLSCEW